VARHICLPKTAWPPTFFWSGYYVQVKSSFVLNIPAVGLSTLRLFTIGNYCDPLVLVRKGEYLSGRLLKMSRNRTY
ncbi:MAG: hypothetical protein QN720_09625, partial [Nitrososphaeraceae archaeon]|nr:hypothetical protein [Nitrososphaeraceae archaeon]MDW0333224.1 hypothetical protein [Nitrososphaeraceae archaeon]